MSLGLGTKGLKTIAVRSQSRLANSRRLSHPNARASKWGRGRGVLSLLPLHAHSCLDHQSLNFNPDPRSPQGCSKQAAATKQKVEERKTGFVEFPWQLSRLRTRLVSMRTLVGSLALLSGLRIQCCPELWCRSQTWLGSRVAVAVV